MQTADALTLAVEEKCGPNGLVAWYLMASLLYYHFDESLLSDERFDQIGKTLKEHWDTLTHQHRHFIEEGELEAGTLSLRLEQFPLVTRSAAISALSAIGRKLDDAAVDRLWKADFIPPERLQDDASLYAYSQQGGFRKSWRQVREEAAKEFAERQAKVIAPVRSRVRPAPPQVVPDAVRTRSRPSAAPVVETPAVEVRARTRVRSS